MLLSNQQKYILEILKEFKYLRVRQLHALVQAHYRTQGIKIDERRIPQRRERKKRSCTKRCRNFRIQRRI